jgi:YggT family protein
MFVLIINAVLSFLPQMRYSPFRQGLETISNIMLNPLRRLFRPIGGIDFSPYVAILILIFADTFLVKTLADIGYRLR